MSIFLNARMRGGVYIVGACVCVCVREHTVFPSVFGVCFSPDIQSQFMESQLHSEDLGNLLLAVLGDREKIHPNT